MHQAALTQYSSWDLAPGPCLTLLPVHGLDETLGHCLEARLAASVDQKGEGLSAFPTALDPSQ